ncbi:N-acetylmuramoyl-L-alanine amidase [Marinovum sp. 2_MG-2023]|uniref:N-acetylmuramoyl-L-alanine amidase n=1 Tax=unclassified Marinovum TaxID=2647166 RepID=UPI0026E197CE|nr:MULTISPECIES: N-acetylmuramoyl-L-alanine amidase [unclassified Marinovum]MDO6728727.1 N-acetylmuramoyl-L-alanine amidase [Marinovum sp. 2_MG-2023]MDO6777857.1 N-acetylmuramoyl-L-alanine amidase [Marinovum sp. 1_MG-2023]
MVVLHYTAMTTTVAARDWLCNPVAEVSAHYLISTTGELIQMVGEDQRAWHAGAGSWGGVTDVNSRSIGIEITNSGTQPYSEPQMACLEALLPRIMARWDIAPQRVIGHSDMAPGRKIDPGRRFDWRRLARMGLSIWPETGLADVARRDEATVTAARFRALAVLFGYGPAVDDATLLDAFRARFRPAVTGPLDRCDIALLADLSTRFPVDRAAHNP